MLAGVEAPSGEVRVVAANPLRFCNASAWACAAAFAASACCWAVVVAEGAAGVDGCSAISTPAAAAPMPAAINGIKGTIGGILHPLRFQFALLPLSLGLGRYLVRLFLGRKFADGRQRVAAHVDCRRL